MKKIQLILLFFVGNIHLFAQDNNQNPTALKWSQIKTPHFQLIFPSQISMIGNRTANVLETVYQPISQSLGVYPKPISIILQNQTTESNGFVTLLPRRSEFFTTPPQDQNLLGTNNWLDLLAVHEFRHIVQFEKARTGFGKFYHFLFGNTALAAMANLTVPNWFWEGDAVGVESSMTTSGRGRIPSFDMALRTQLLTKGSYNYSKAVCGSYKDFIPNHYVSGYYMTTYMKNKFGIDAWDKILEKTYADPPYPFSFSNNIKKTTGLKTEQLYNQAFTDITEQWKKQADEIQETPVEFYKTDSPKYFTNYMYPQVLEDGKIVVIKSGLADIAQLVILDREMQEKKVLRMGILNDAGTLSVADNKVIWAEFNYHPRWGQKDYSVIKMYDIKYDELKTITPKTKLTAPALSADGSKIVAIENSTDNKCSIVILNTDKGLEVKRITNETKALYIHPRWAGNEEVYAVKLLNGKKTIVRINTENSQEIELFEPAVENLAYPVKAGNYVLFNSGITGIDNIFAFDLTTKKRYQVTNRKFGAFNPILSNDGKTLIFNDFNIKGHRVASMPFETEQFLPFDENLTKPVKYFGQMVLKEAGENLLKSVPDSQYVVKPYSKANIFNIYSWGVVLNSSESNTLNFGIASKDLLNTTTISTGYAYNANENRGQFYANLTYAGLFPVFNLNYTNGERYTEFFIDRDSKLDSLRSDTWNQQQVVLGVNLPLNLTRSKYIQSMNFGVNTALTTISGYDLKERPNTLSYDGSLNSMIYTFSYSHLLKRAARDVASRWGQTVSLYYRDLPFGGSLDGGITAVQASVFVPGLSKHHSLRLRGGFQNQTGYKAANGSPNQNLYLFGSPIVFPRGHSYRSFENFQTGSVEYRLPLLDPDFAIGRFVYLKRFKATLFADFGYGSTNYNWTETVNGRTVNYRGSITGNFTTFGIDLTTQFHFMRFNQQFEAGIRAMYLPDKGQYLIQPLVLDIGF
jgi:WD40-like Beta Propeller Repeat